GEKELKDLTAAFHAGEEEIIVNLDNLKDLSGASVVLPLGMNQFFLRITTAAGVQNTAPRSIKVLDDFGIAGNFAIDGTVRGTLTGDVYNVAQAAMPKEGIVIYGGGGSDRLDFGGMLSTDVLSFDGAAISTFVARAGSPGSQAFYHGTAFDYLR